MMLHRCFLAICFALAVAAQAHAGPKDKRLDVYWIDVEGGAATLLVTPAGETVLIDTGNPGRRDPDRIVKAVTEVAGMKQIDHLVITHYHGDHFGGAATLEAWIRFHGIGNPAALIAGAGKSTSLYGRTGTLVLPA